MQITTTNGGSLSDISDQDLMRVLQSSLYPKASPDSIKLVLGYCKASGLDPMQKPVHIVPMWDSKSNVYRDVIMPGVGLYRTLAARSGCLGISEPEFGPGVTKKIGDQEITFPQWCRVTVKRKLSSGDVAEFTAKEFWLENYATQGGKEKSIAPNAMWSKRPFGQIAKCAEAQALRKAFPEVGSQPTADEMEGQIIERDEVDITPSKATVQIPQRKKPDVIFEQKPEQSETNQDSAPDQSHELAQEGQKNWLLAKIKSIGVSIEELSESAQINKRSDLNDLSLDEWVAMKEALAGFAK